MKKIFFTLCVLLITLTSNAQLTNDFGLKIDGGYGLAIKDGDNTIQFAVMPGYHINKNWFVGAGVGYYNLMTQDMGNINIKSLSAFPIFAHAQWNIVNKSKVTPYLATRLGYAPGSMTYEKGDNSIKFTTRFYILGEFGIKFPVSTHAISLSITYNYVGLRASLNNNIYALTGENQTFALHLGFEL